MKCANCGDDLYFGGKGHQCQPKIDEPEETKQPWIEEAGFYTDECWEAIDVRLAVQNRLAVWMDTAAQNQRNADYYRDLLDACGNSIGKEAFIADDGSISQDVLRAKVPEIIGRDYAEVATKREAPFILDVLDFHNRVGAWLIECFGEEIAYDKAERNHRFLEEALELVQSFGCTKSEASQLVEYVYARDVGEPHQEIGGVMVTLNALCFANYHSANHCGEIELRRIQKKMPEIRAKQAAKPKHSPLPMAVDDSDPKDEP